MAHSEAHNQPHLARNELRLMDYLAGQLPAGETMEASWAQYRKRFLRGQLPGLLDGLGYGAAAAVGGYFLFHWLGPEREACYW